MKVIDCKKTKNYLSERKRMCERNQCDECPLSSKINGTNKICRVFENDYPSEAMKIVQDWSDRNPPNTILDNFNKLYPDAVKAENGIPHICCAKLGLVEYCGELFSMDCERCKSCWNTIAKESEVK